MKSVPRLKTKYQQEVVPALMQQFNYSSVMQAPRLLKICINQGIGDATGDKKMIDNAANELSTIVGQKAVSTKARTSVSNFKLREGMPIGLRVTLRGARMWEFLDRLVNVAMPRIRDFQGLDPRRGFDGRGNFNLGLTEQYVFPEISLDKSDKARGMNITIVTDAQRDDTARELLILLGMPFKRDRKAALN